VLSKTLGTGATGKVKLGFHRDSGFKVAIKIISKNALQSRPAMQQKLEREIAIMKFLDHPHVLKLYDVYDTPNYLFLVLEHVEGGELFDYLLSKGKLSDQEALKFFQQMVEGVSYSHAHLICHRDLKPENILLDANLEVKICDFGMAALMPKDALLATSCGSPHYASPEVITGRKYDGFEADVWSLGVILYALLVGRLPFDDPNMRKLLLKVKIGVFEMPPNLEKTAKDLLWRMLTVDPEKRARLSEVRQHPWFLSNGGPQNSSFNKLDVDKVVPFSADEDIDPEVVQTLTALWGDEEAVLADLMGDETNLTKVFYRLIQERFKKREEEEKAAAANEPPATPEPEQEPKSFRARARKSFSYFRPGSSEQASPQTNRSAGSSPTKSNPASPSPSPREGTPTKFLSRRSSQGPNQFTSSSPAATGGDGSEPRTPERGGFMRKLSLTRLKSPTAPMQPSALDAKLFTTSVQETGVEASSPLNLTGASPRKSWFHFFSRGNQVKPAVGGKAEQPPLARSIMTPLPSEELWAKVHPILEDMEVALLYSKNLRCLKASTESTTPKGTPDKESKFLIRMSSLFTPRGTNCTYLHWEFRSGSPDDFLNLFDTFRERCASAFPLEMGEEPGSDSGATSE